MGLGSDRAAVTNEVAEVSSPAVEAVGQSYAQLLVEGLGVRFKV